jgi:hypothetical protein
MGTVSHFHPHCVFLPSALHNSASSDYVSLQLVCCSSCSLCLCGVVTLLTQPSSEKLGVFIQACLWLTVTGPNQLRPVEESDCWSTVVDGALVDVNRGGVEASGLMSSGSTTWFPQASRRQQHGRRCKHGCSCGVNGVDLPRALYEAC